MYITIKLKALSFSLMLKANLEQQKPKQQPGTYIKVHVLVSKIALTFDS